MNRVSPISVAFQLVAVLLGSIAVWTSVALPAPALPFFGISALALVCILLSRVGPRGNAEPLGSGIDAESAQVHANQL